MFLQGNARTALWRNAGAWDRIGPGPCAWATSGM